MKTNPYGSDGVNFWSSEYEDGTKRPMLEIELAAE
jgi:hypothetical protein